MQVNNVSNQQFTGLLGVKAAKKVYKKGTIGRKFINDAQNALKQSGPYHVAYDAYTDTFGIVGTGHAPLKTVKTPTVEIGKFSPSGRANLRTEDGDEVLVRIVHLGQKRKMSLIDILAGRCGRDGRGLLQYPEDLPRLVKIVKALDTAAKAVTEKV